MPKIATFLRALEGFNGDARLYKLSEPVKYRDEDDNEHETDHVMVSGVQNFFANETYIFPSDSIGDILDWMQLDGSFQGGIDHEKALREAGYELNG